jgi:large subunit ribosomal protein L30
MKLKIELVRSPIGKIPKHRATVRALGLKKLHQVVVKDKNPMILGMVASIDYMLSVEEVKE